MAGRVVPSLRSYVGMVRHGSTVGGVEAIVSTLAVRTIGYVGRMDAVLQALGDGSRRTMLEILRDHPATVTELAEALPIARPACRGTCGCCARPAWCRWSRTRSDASTASARRR